MYECMGVCVTLGAAEHRAIDFSSEYYLLKRPQRPMRRGGTHFACYLTICIYSATFPIRHSLERM
jgi:hypothetical protein